jgi:curli biogenesis system outer membrane secretion channel CsgG
VKKLILISPLLFFCLVMLSSCGDKGGDVPKDPNVKDTAAPDSLTESIRKTPDVGGIEKVDVTAKGVGITPGAAINEALKTAIMQVNGTAISSISANLNTLSQTTADIDVETSRGSGSANVSAVVQSSNFADLIVSRSGGVVSSFQVTQITPPEDTSGIFSRIVKPSGDKGGVYTVEIKAQIAKFKAPADAGKIKIVIAPMRSSEPYFNIGGRRIPAQDVLDPVRQQLIDALTQSGRFLILDRQFEDDVQKEMYLIASGQTNNENIAKLGQALSADLIWIGVVNNLAYEKHVRQLQTSDRSLVGFSGAWSISQRMINMTTRQVMLSNTLSDQFPTIAPTTLGANFNETNLLKDLQVKIVQKATEAIMLRTFPISIVEIDGDSVALSQGEGSLKENDRYNVYRLGKEIKDPQTGESLGNMESLFGEVVITRVTPKMSYGRLENVKGALAGVQPGSLQIREAITVQNQKAKVDVPKQATASAKTAKPSKSKLDAESTMQRESAKPLAPNIKSDERKPSAPANDDDW